jgi:pantetheine-phosphate adenylyltransferase
MKENTVIYPGTFDPITLGHIDLVERTLCLFDRLIIAIAENHTKSPLFSLQERIDLAKEIFQDQDQVEVVGFDCLLVDFAKEKGANIILRGLRVISDFDYEFRMANTNRTLTPEIETIFLIPSERYAYFSSSLVREVALLKGDVSKFVPKIVVKALHKKLQG